MLEMKLPIVSKMGLDARNAANIITLTNSFDSEITIRKGNEIVNGKSILGLLMLAAVRGTFVTVRVEGEDEDSLFDRVIALFASGQDVVHSHVRDFPEWNFQSMLSHVSFSEIRPKTRTLFLANCRFSALPIDQNILNIRSLHIYDSKVTNVGDQIERMKDLERLDLKRNAIEYISPSLGKLVKLKGLYLDNNSLTSLPSEIGSLTNLVAIGLTGNQLTEIPSEIGKLQRLSELDLSNNKIEEIPAGVVALGNLIRIVANNNKIRKIPNNIGKLKKLKKLVLSKNNLEELPSSIGKLTKLEVLDLRGNKLTSLPKEIGYLSNLSELLIDDNPWDETFTSIIKLGTDSLMAYLHSLLKKGKPHYETKVLLIGDGNVGKTSLVGSLRNEKFIENRPTTHGIEIDKIQLKHPKEKDVEIVLNVWDFGGQEVYRITHQFFFSRRSLYILVWNTRENMSLTDISNWLDQLRIRVPDAKVVLVATHCEERPSDIDIDYFKRIFGDMICDHLEVDNSTGKGIDKLRNVLAKLASELPQMGEVVNPSWLSALDGLNELKKSNAQISQAAFIELLNSVEVSESEIGLISQLLHDLGHIIYFPGDSGLHDIVVLQPEWLTKAISYVLNDRATMDNYGVLVHSDLKKIWFSHGNQDREPYAIKYHPYFLRLMEKFDICYRFENGDQSLVAQMVPHREPVLDWSCKGTSKLDLYCNLENIPPGLISWLTVRNYRFSTGIHWRKGVFLRHQEHLGVMNLVSDHQMNISVRGSSPGHFMSLLRDSFEYLVEQRWPGLVYHLTIPCINNKNEDGCGGVFDLSDLDRAGNMKVAELQCHKCFEKNQISDLLNGYISPENPTEVTEIHQSIRSLTRMLISEANNGPSLYTLSPKERSNYDVRRLTRMGKVEYTLRLWCEHPEHWHPLDPEGVYTCHLTGEWMRRISPYLGIAVKTLKFIVSALVPGSKILLEDADQKLIHDELDFMARTNIFIPGEASVENLLDDYSLGQDEGAGLRMFHQLLTEVDPLRKWGGLKKATNQTGDIIWVCPEHYSYYDRGIPKLK